MEATQLETNLWQSLKDAVADPEAANLNQLWQVLEKTVEKLPCELRLQMLGQAIEQMAEILARRSDLLLSAWEETHNSCGPVVREDVIAGFVRQTMALDLSEFVDHSGIAVRSRRLSELDQSVTGSIDKNALLKVIEDIEVTNSQAQAVKESLDKAHLEDISQWVEEIAQWMKCQGKGEAISIVQIQQALEMPLVEVWLGLLHSPGLTYKLEQQGQFYDPEGIWLFLPG